MQLPLVAYVDFVSSLLPFGVGVSRRGNMTVPLRLFLIYMLMGIVVEIVSYILANQKISNLWLMQCYHLGAYSLLIVIIGYWVRGILLSRILRWGLIVYILTWGFAKFSFEPFTGPDQYTFSGVSIVIAVASLVALFQRVSLENKDIWTDPQFWLISGLFLYFTGNLVLFSVLDQYIQVDRTTAFMVWTVHWYFDIMINVIFTRGYFLVGRR